MATKPHGHRDDWYLMANARDLALSPIAAVRGMSNLVFASRLFATGCNSAFDICKQAGIDPYGTEVLHGTQPDREPDPLAMPAGWRFSTADFSCIAAGRQIPGSVTLIRDPAGRAAWHAQPDEALDGVDGLALYAYGTGMTLDEAMQNAIKNALAARPIPTTESPP